MPGQIVLLPICISRDGSSAKELRDTLENGVRKRRIDDYRDGGRRSDRLFLERLPVTSADEGAFFRAKVQGAYDWLHSIQFATKRLRSITAYAMDLLEYDQDSNRRCFPK